MGADLFLESRSPLWSSGRAEIWLYKKSSLQSNPNLAQLEGSQMGSGNTELLQSVEFPAGISPG
ncbi:hypothetical protein DV515_00017951 [Chloebia gouldiae]|uniref:Uncharacterized protein n=1 Tax=Chloebia gouldiae TaxID=44316 RepID=A0A3L8Q8U7_CHLGU|nr:hypothetical protein DV515_00017951 [Chloebia gouldiae]